MLPPYTRYEEQEPPRGPRARLPPALPHSQPPQVSRRAPYRRGAGGGGDVDLDNHAEGEPGGRVGV